MPLLDQRQRPLENLRLSVTDRCNLRCRYCMPEENYRWLDKSRILTFEEISRVVDAFVAQGVRKVRVTGGEPLLRADLPRLIEMLAQKSAIRDLAMTTNGVLLAQHAQALRDAGLHRLTVSLDSLDRTTYRLLANRDDLDRTLAGIAAARDAGFEDIKLDTVVIAGINDRELPDLIEFAREQEIEVRFIEYMDVGGATLWRPERVVSRSDMLAQLTARCGAIRELPRHDSAPAERFELGDGTRFGIISSMTQPFCGTCDRSRLTADGMWFTCLYAERGHDLRALVRDAEAPAERLAEKIERVWSGRTDAGAEMRLASDRRGPLADAEHLRDNPHLEMHTRGG
ncbi:MAG: GTP 3',8-cyclase MoaA [bacterium]|nr:GTP 3',8-cyclase MoaA [bacterium]